MYEVTWQQIGNGPSLRKTTTAETSYIIKDLAPGTSYEIGITAYSGEDPNIRSEIIQVSLTTKHSLLDSCKKHFMLIKYDYNLQNVLVYDVIYM